MKSRFTVKQCKIFVAILIVFIQISWFGIDGIWALENGLARTPPMGWNSWNYFGGSISDSLVRQIADAMVSSGMQAAGYTYINIDDMWQISRDGNGNIVAESSKFPNGMKALADYVHSKGLKLGLYSDRGTATCAGRPGSHGYETKDAASYASWGIDYLKYDNCNADSDMQADYERMRDALLGCGRPICYSLCAWWFYTWEPNCGNLWRSTGDISANWSSICSNMDTNASLAQYAGPGHWNDPDMLEVGNGSLSTAESRAHFSMWCIMASPLIAGNDIRSMSQTVKDILTNPEAIAVNQDAAGIQGTRVVDNGDLEVWCKPLGSANGSTKAVALLNRSGSAANITVNWSTIGLSGSANVRDLWAKADRGSYSGSYTANVPSHDVVMITIGGSAVGTPEPVQPTTAPVCNPVAIVPYLQVDGGTWQTVSSVTVSSGATVIIGPQPLTGGTWSWSGCGVSGTAREQTIHPASSCSATATYTNDCGAASMQVFTITVSGTAVTKGDVNSNGTIDIVDALLIAQYYVGLNPANFNSAAADVNCSGAIDIVDALLVAQRYVGLISNFPC